ncbi:hypothetical protein SNEBB_011178 [Seison nebaliae]|nr:hypothetical protein SNEBB_011178 [Seison nebaliae]
MRKIYYQIFLFLFVFHIFVLYFIISSQTNWNTYSHADSHTQHFHRQKKEKQTRPQTTTSSTSTKIQSVKSKSIAILLLACKRVDVKIVLRSINEKNRKKFPIIVSQDCGDKRTKNVILSFQQQIDHIIFQPNQTDPNVKKFSAYYKISRHYKFALDFVFVEKSYDSVIIIEDDLNISTDFFEYFEATYPLLKDPSSNLLCSSAWNDNGQEYNIDEKASKRLWRSDFFPGLGWMMVRSTYMGLKDKWPNGFWDDWIRLPNNRLGRQCIRPEISRSSTFGKTGSSNGLFFDLFLKNIKLNNVHVHWLKEDLSYLKKDIFHNNLENFLTSCTTEYVCKKGILGKLETMVHSTTLTASCKLHPFLQQLNGENHHVRLKALTDLKELNNSLTHINSSRVLVGLYISGELHHFFGNYPVCGINSACGIQFSKILDMKDEFKVSGIIKPFRIFIKTENKSYVVPSEMVEASKMHPYNFHLKTKNLSDETNPSNFYRSQRGKTIQMVLGLKCQFNETVIIEPMPDLSIGDDVDMFLVDSQEMTRELEESQKLYVIGLDSFDSLNSQYILGAISTVIGIVYFIAVPVFIQYKRAVLKANQQNISVPLTSDTPPTLPTVPTLKL